MNLGFAIRVIVLVGALLALGVLTAGIVGAGASQRWWTAGLFNSLGLPRSLIMISAGLLGTLPIGIIGIAYLAKKQLSTPQSYGYSIDSSEEYFRPLNRIGKKEWASHFGDIGKEPPVPIGIGAILEQQCPFFKDKKVSETHTLVLIPATVNGQATTLNKVIELFQKQQINCAFSKEVQQAYGDTPIQKSYWVLSPYKISLERPEDHNSYEMHRKWIENAGYLLPRAIEESICILMEHALTGLTHAQPDTGFNETPCCENITTQTNENGVVFVGYDHKATFNILLMAGVFLTKYNRPRRIGAVLRFE